VAFEDGALEALAREALGLAGGDSLTCAALAQLAELDVSAAGITSLVGIQNAVTGDSLCANTMWEITAQTAGAANSARVTVTQGVGVRISIDDMATSCL